MEQIESNFILYQKGQITRQNEAFDVNISKNSVSRSSEVKKSPTVASVNFKQ